MTFEEFQATRTVAPKGTREIVEVYGEEFSGYVYRGWLAIADHPEGGYWLLLENREWISANLAELEKTLWEYGEYGEV